MKSIVIVDDHLLIREGMKSLLESTGQYRVAVEFANGASLLKQGDLGKIDLILLDITMPGRSGLEVLREIRKRDTRVPIIIVSMHAEEHFAVKAIQGGANGYISRTSMKEEILDGVDTVLRGGLYLTGTGNSTLMNRLSGGSERDDILGSLSEREKAVMLLLCRGKIIKEIAYELDISHKTVSTYKTRIMQKTGTGTLADLIKFGIDHALVQGSVCFSLLFTQGQRRPLNWSPCRTVGADVTRRRAPKKGGGHDQIMRARGPVWNP